MATLALSFLTMEAQVLSSSVSTPGVPLFTSLSEEGVTGNSKRVHGMADLNQEMADPWIRVEPWDALLCRGTTVGDEKVYGGQYCRRSEALQVRDCRDRGWDVLIL